ncbi:MAG: hypothetical protein ACHQEM_02040 [Chitinophagales bacterium]
MRKTRVIQKMARAKKSKSLRSNIAVHPYVIASIVASIAIITWAIIFEGWHFMTSR